MWIVAKTKKKELHIFKKELIKRFGSQVKFYIPKIQYQIFINNKIKKVDKFILENYVFCYHENLKQNKIINEIQFLKGSEYFLSGYHQNQKEIIKFINYCKLFENKDGYLSQAFFKKMIIKKAQFISGPFTNLIFEILKKRKNKLKILVGNVVTTISDNSNYLYRPI